MRGGWGRLGDVHRKTDSQTKAHSVAPSEISRSLLTWTSLECFSIKYLVSGIIAATDMSNTPGPRNFSLRNVNCTNNPLSPILNMRTCDRLECLVWYLYVLTTSQQANLKSTEQTQHSPSLHQTITIHSQNGQVKKVVSLQCATPLQVLVHRLRRLRRRRHGHGAQLLKS